MSYEKSLIMRENIEDVTLTVEMIANPNSYLFGEFGISASYNGTYSKFLLLDSEVKDVCNCILKSESIDDLLASDIEEIQKIVTGIINFHNWKSVASSVCPILNATLSKEEIDCCTNGDDAFTESNIIPILQWKSQGTTEIFQYDSTDDLIRFVTQMFICDWIQSLDGIRLALGKRTSINKIDDIWDYISNPNFDDAIKNGKNIRESTIREVS